VKSEELSHLLVAAILLVAIPVGAQTPETPQPAQPPQETSEPAQPGSTSPPLGTPHEATWRTSLYGFAELDAMHDTTQSYGPASNNAILARPGTYAGAHPRTQFTIDNSQIGLRIAAPEFHSMKASGGAEVDFFGVQPTDATEQIMFTTPSVRIRLMYVKLETPVIDVMAGQYHDLFAWGGEGFYQNSVAFLGVAGEIYHRNPQIRLSKTFRSATTRLDIAVAAVRPVQRDSETPDLQGGVKFAWNGWQGANAQGFGQPNVLPLAIGVSGVWRRFAVAEFLGNPGDPKIAYGWGLAANAFLPVIPARSAAKKGNALSLTGEFSTGTGISDLYTGLTGGALFPLLPDPSGGLVPPPLYRPNIDSGIVTYDADGNLKTIDWRAFVVGLQYYLPIDEGRVWVSATYSHLMSSNILSLTPEASRGGIFIQQDYVDANLFATVTPAVQMGVSYQMTQQTFGDYPFDAPHPQGRNHRGEMGLRFFF
jgi:hypothetical protein